ncbi:PAS domain S-box protein [Nostoc parmelioides]|uniref:histidine kinase n=1 Tax=Nostoc parmelioides FACHB-3921 TaxID=2692909 RepID=A0ABR8BGV7_9NOSO|nr:PAS domain S-box protein [Nostoc parmelioides]MBD2252924.1 PAS domain S-box protein [Nostoc parmelioides FACHB-3921]
MSNIQRSHLQRYCISILSVVLALLLGLTLGRYFKVEISPLFFASVVFSSWYGGLAPGLVATVLSILLKNYFFIAPFNSLFVNQGSDLLNLIVFGSVAVLISSLNSQVRAARQMSEAKLAKLKVNYHHLLETAHEGIWIFDSEGKTEYVNPQLAQMLGYSVEQISDRSIFNFLEPQAQLEIEQWLEQQQKYHHQTQQKFDLRLQHHDGASLWVIVSLSSILDKHRRFSGAIAMLTDITERKQAEETLAQGQAKRDLERQRLRAILDILPMGVVISDAKGQLLEINPGAKAIWGEDAPLLDNTSQYHQYKGWWPDTGKPLTAEEWTLARTLATGEAIIGEEIDIETFDGKRKTILNSAVPICDAKGTIVNAVTVNVDITERKRVEAAFRQSEALAKARAEELETIMETVPAAVWIAHDPHCHSMSVNRAAYDMMRVPPGSVMTATPASGGYPFPFKIQKNGQDIPLNELAMQQAGLTGQEVEAEVEFVFSPEDVRHIYGKAIPLRDPNGNVRGVIGAFLDVTERQQLMSLLQQKQEWLDLAQKSGKIGSFDWKLPSNINVWSQELEEIYGLQPGEFGGTFEDWAKCVHPDDLARVEVELQELLNTGSKEFFSDFRIIRQDGSLCWLQSRARVFYDDHGQPLRMVGVNIDVTERKQAEAALQQSEARLKRLLQSSIIGIIEADSERINFANDAFLKMVGYTQEDLLTGKLRWQDMTPPEYSELDQAKVAEVINSGFCIPFEKEYIRKDGSRVPILLGAARLSSSPLTWVCFILDLTDRKQAEAALQQSELMFRTLADTMPQMFWITQPNGYHEYFNQRWYDYTGTTLEQTQGEGWQKILHPDDVERTIEHWHDCLDTGKDYDIEYRLRRAVDGEYRWHLGRAFPLRDKNGQILKWFGSCTDIHDQKLAIEERAQAWEQERAARIELERANRMKDDFLAIVSHELRSPLNPILGWAKLLKSRKLDTFKTHQALEVIERNAKLQARLIDDLLDVSRILRGKLSLNVCTVDLVTTIEAALETVRLTAESKSIHIQTELTSHVCRVEGDPNRLQQVVWNLLSNAVKFTPEGGQIEVSLERVGSLAHIQVRDTGKGISLDFLPYVFERFRQADEVTTRKFGGLGLGLAIVRHLVELHGGSVQVTSPGEGLGTAFTVKLPLIAVSQIYEEHFIPDTTPNLQGLRMVVVDDDADTLELLSFILEQYGVEVKAVNSANEALEAIAHTKPDLLLSDIGMPEVDGYMLIKQIRTMEVASGTKLPAIALTAFAGETNFQKIMSAGFQRHLTKPVEPSELATVIANLIQSNS